MIGTELGRYRVTSLLGEGGMGSVYLAVQPAIGSRVAIKVLSEQCARDAELLERFFAEARAVNLIRHEHIVSVLDLATLPDGRPYIVMEYVEGQTLAAYIRGKTAPLGGVLQVMGEVLSALAAAHAIGIVHRDLKPDNVIVTVEGHAKVLDFGIAKLAPGMHDASSRTKTGAILGTPSYMAPEQISGAGSVDARADIYAAGILLYEAVTGRLPFTGATIFDIMRAQVDEAPAPPRTLRPDLPEAVEHVILTALAKDPAMRFQSAQAMAQALAHAAATLPPDQWIPLSSRGGPRISATGQGSPTPQITPQAPSARMQAPPSTPSVGPSPPASIPGAVGGRTEARTRRTGLVVGVLAVLAVAAGIALFVAGRSPAGDDSKAVAQVPPAPADAATTVAVAPPSADAATPVAPPPAPVAPPPSPGAPVHHALAAAADAAVDVGPTIVIGGSAADHGVFIGSNVQIGSNVVIGTQTLPPAAASKNEISQRADYDPKHFDPIAYLPKAAELAKALAPDAKLTELEFDPVFSDGHVDLTMEGRDREYNFRSPSRSKHPDDVPPNLDVERACMIHVEIGVHEVTARIQTSDTCNAAFVRWPKCHFAALWQQALAQGVPKTYVARIGWLAGNDWYFDTALDGAGGQHDVEDRCP